MAVDRSKQAYTSMMKFTIDGRPFIKDVHDLFAALIVQIPLSVHRYLFRNYVNTFTTEEAISALGSLRFSYSTRSPDPSDANKMIRTTTTTTFNMAKDMAKALCQQFQQCHLMRNATDPASASIGDKTIWQLTPKGLCILQDFCIRTDVDVGKMRRHFTDIQPIHLVRLERHSDDDTLMMGRQHLVLIYIVMIHSLPLDGDAIVPTVNASQQQLNALPALAKSSPSSRHNNATSGGGGSSTSSVSSGSSASSLPSNHLTPFAMSTHVVSGDSKVQLLGNYLLTLSKSTRHAPLSSSSSSGGSPTAQVSKVSARRIRSLFSTQLACDWLMDFSTISAYEEGQALLTEFLRYNWLEYQSEKYADDAEVRVGKTVLLSVTEKGKQILTDANQHLDASAGGATRVPPPAHHAKMANHGLMHAATGADATIVAANDEATLKEMLAQDPETAILHQRHVPRRQSSISSSHSSSTLDNGNGSGGGDPSSRPSSMVAMDYPSDAPIGAGGSAHGGSAHGVSSTGTLTGLPGAQGGDFYNGKETNASKLKQILDDAQMRPFFKDFLRQNFCEENLDFWIDYSTLRRKIRNQSPALPSQNQKDLLEDAYDIWATYLKPGASSELNVEHSLRQEMARVVNSMVTVVPTYLPAQQTTKNTLVISSHSVSQSLRLILKWLDQVNDYICRLMATDSVPKFVRTPKYKKLLDAREQEQKKQQEEYLLQRKQLDESLFFDVQQP
ncbi:regulator of G protein signaling domain-containing protein [Gongronella butleri]|nr:regulator of G protein signaling domain-containing protein [Gongronella butleri]